MYYSTKEALGILHEKGIDVSHVTFINWINRHKLGVQPGGYRANRFVNKEKLHAFLDQL